MKQISIFTCSKRTEELVSWRTLLSFLTFTSHCTTIALTCQHCYNSFLIHSMDITLDASLNMALFNFQPAEKTSIAYKMQSLFPVSSRLSTLKTSVGYETLSFSLSVAHPDITCYYFVWNTKLSKLNRTKKTQVTCWNRSTPSVAGKQRDEQTRHRERWTDRLQEGDPCVSMFQQMTQKLNTNTNWNLTTEPQQSLPVPSKQAESKQRWTMSDYILIVLIHYFFPTKVKLVNDHNGTSLTFWTFKHTMCLLLKHANKNCLKDRWTDKWSPSVSPLTQVTQPKLQLLFDN